MFKNFRILLTILFLGSTLLLANGFQMLSLVIRPFSLKIFRRVNSIIADIWWGLCVRAGEYFYGIKIIVSGDEIPHNENTIVVLNHQSMTDITTLLAYAKSKGRLGDLKWFVKDIIKYFPGVGWGMLFLDCLFIKRNWTEDKKYIHKMFEKILRYSIPLWLVSFVEGTRIRPSKLIQSQKYAQENGLPLLKHLLLPRTKGFVASVQALRPHLQAVYDMTVGYVQEVPTLWQWIRGDVRKVFIHVRRFPINALPQEESDLSQWLMDLFVKKDKLLDQFYKNGSF